jgi:hypothetical protein
MMFADFDALLGIGRHLLQGESMTAVLVGQNVWKSIRQHNTKAGSRPIAVAYLGKSLAPGLDGTLHFSAASTSR